MILLKIKFPRNRFSDLETRANYLKLKIIFKERTDNESYIVCHCVNESCSASSCTCVIVGKCGKFIKCDEVSF